MREDDVMDRLLTRALAADVPELGPGFDEAVMRRVRPRRLSRSGTVVMVCYTVAAVAVTAWALRDLDPAVVAAGVSAGLAVAAGIGAYVQSLTARL